MKKEELESFLSRSYMQEYQNYCIQEGLAFDFVFGGNYWGYALFSDSRGDITYIPFLHPEASLEILSSLGSALTFGIKPLLKGE